MSPARRCLDVIGPLDVARLPADELQDLRPLKSDGLLPRNDFNGSTRNTCSALRARQRLGHLPPAFADRVGEGRGVYAAEGGELAFGLRRRRGLPASTRARSAPGQPDERAASASARWSNTSAAPPETATETPLTGPVELDRVEIYTRALGKPIGGKSFEPRRNPGISGDSSESKWLAPTTVILNIPSPRCR